MLKITFILGAIAVAANVLFIWYAKRRGPKTIADKSPSRKRGSGAVSQGFLNSEEGKILKQSAAGELGISVEELDHMSIEEITYLAKLNEVIK
ncbi:MAG: hypothetical protein JRF56_02525 [Deltaproteobacteria bacterium]|jgi:hypothetical protein|nr:hypothetical protein [Deltaproteobacteria bacterium]